MWGRHISPILISLNPYSQTQIKRPTHFMLAIAKISNPFAHSTNRFMFPCETTEQEQYVCLDYIILVFLKFYLSPKTHQEIVPICYLTSLLLLTHLKNTTKLSALIRVCEWEKLGSLSFISFIINPSKEDFSIFQHLFAAVKLTYKMRIGNLQFFSTPKYTIITF